ncbi:MAG: NDP-sugar synthase [Candidatus Pacearchaeota archaeon]
MKLLIGTGGKGERLYPLTKDTPKPMIKILGKPVLHYIVDWAKSQDIKEIIMLNGYMANKIQNYFKDGSEFGVRIIHSNEPKPLGSGGSIKYAKKFVDGRFIFLSGDLIINVNLKKMILFHENKNSKITVLVHKSTHPHDSDILDIDENNRVIRFISKNDEHTNAGDLSNAGLAIIEPEIFDLMEKDEFNFESYLFPRIIEKNLDFYAYNTNEFIQDMGTFERLKKCEEYLIKNI